MPKSPPPPASHYLSANNLTVSAGPGGPAGQSFTANLANGGEVMEFNPDYTLPEDAKTLADQTIAGIKDGSITITLP